MRSEVRERENGRRRVVQYCEGESATEQAHANAVNINTIVSRYQRTGVLPPSSRVPRYGDFSGCVDYHSCVEAVRMAEEGFMSLPAELRKRFRNDPGMLLAFLEDPQNRAEAESLGLVDRMPVVDSSPPEPAPVAPVEPVS